MSADPREILRKILWAGEHNGYAHIDTGVFDLEVFNFDDDSEQQSDVFTPAERAYLHDLDATIPRQAPDAVSWTYEAEAAC